MSRYDYQASLEVSSEDPPFGALVMALMRKADMMNQVRIRAAWPEIWKEFRERCDSPGGLIDADVREAMRHG